MKATIFSNDMNMKQIIAFLMLLCTTCVSAQGIQTTFTRQINIKRDYNSPISFNFGDSVTVYGYKKKSGVYYYNIETKYYADLIRSNDIPFAATEKELKKLPNALDDEQKDFMRLRKQLAAQRLLTLKKEKALRGDFMNIVSAHYALSSDDATGGKLTKGDTVYIVGYKGGAYSDYQYALYNDKVAGVYKTSSDYSLFYKKFDKNDLPSVDDPDVIKFLEGKRQEILQRKAEEKMKYRKLALSGKIQGFGSFASFLKRVEDESTPFEDKDTITIVGYSDYGGSQYYALYSYSSGVVGNFKSTSRVGTIFRNSSEIDFSKMPAYDDPEVKLVIEQQKPIIDSLMQIRLAESRKRLAEAATNLINIYKENQPFIIKDISWSSNSVGGIEVSLSITNCTQQTIKYVTFQGFFKNAVGDKCRNEIGGGSAWKARGIGPIGPCPSTVDNCSERLYDCKGSYTFDNLTFYSRVADTFKLSSVTVQYTNGKTITLSGANLDKHVRY